MAPFTRRVYDVVRRIPRGRVASYGGVAAVLGRPRGARGVGWALASLPPGSDVPWWRVINRNGEISLPGHAGALQRALLEAEGVAFDPRGRVDWKRFGWLGPEENAAPGDPPEANHRTRAGGRTPRSPGPPPADRRTP